MTTFLPKSTQGLDLKKLFIAYPKPSMTFQLDEKHSRKNKSNDSESLTKQK
jgi:hypothetical protein